MSIVRGFFSGIFCSILIIVLVILGIIITLNSTILNPDFVISEIDKLDIYSVATQELEAQLPQDEPRMTQALAKTIDDLEPWLEDQLDTAIYAAYDYIKGGQELNLVISLEPVRSSFKENIRGAILESLPPELEGASASEIEAFLAEAYAEIDSQIPQEFELSESSLPPEIVDQLQQVRETISYVELGYKALIGLAVLLLLSIALIHWWRAKPISRSTGIAFAISGLISYLSTMSVNHFIDKVNQIDMPVELQTRLPQLAGDLIAPLQIYGICFLAAGIGLIVLSFVLKSTGEADMA